MGPRNTPASASTKDGDTPLVGSAQGRVLKPSDAVHLDRLGVDGVLGVVDRVEQMHHNIGRLAPPLARIEPGPARGISGLVDRAVRGAVQSVGGALDVGLGGLARSDSDAGGGVRREAWLAALNGVLGDRLAAQQDPLAIEMCMRREGQWVDAKAEALRQAWPNAGPCVLVLVHGLCMSDLQWARCSPHDLPSIGDDLGCTVAGAALVTVPAVEHEQGAPRPLE
jgi:hypothetical protein